MKRLLDDIVLAEGNNELNVGLTPVAPPGLVLHFSNPKFGATFWTARIFDLITGEGVAGTPIGIKQVSEDIPMAFELTGDTFLLYINEWSIGFQTWLGPYLVTVPSLGEYTWDSREGKLDGIFGLELPETNNRSLVTGMVESISWLGVGRWGVGINLTMVRGVEGYENVAQYFIGQGIHIEKTVVPVSSTGTILITKGREITCILEAGYLTTPIGAPKRLAWSGWDFHYPLEYPPEYYEFSGSLIARQISGTVPNAIFDVDYSILGNAPQFTVLIVLYNAIGIPHGPPHYPEYLFTGPVSGTLYNPGIQPGYQFGGYLIMYAHPSPSPPTWGKYTWELDNWQRVAYVR
ncbi:hypothetical protein ES705_12381 [subsurface metagenome]